MNYCVKRTKKMTNNKLQFKKALELITQSSNILLTTHEGTDGDALGSALAMHGFLKQLSIPHKIVIKGGVPDNLSFLPDNEEVEEEIPDLDFDLLITFGCNKIERTGYKQFLKFTQPIINFDHHPDNM